MLSNSLESSEIIRFTFLFYSVIMATNLLFIIFCVFFPQTCFRCNWEVFYIKGRFEDKNFYSVRLAGK